MNLPNAITVGRIALTPLIAWLPFMTSWSSRLAAFALFHQGERESMYLADVARRVILVVLFDNRTTLGLVKLRVRTTVPELVKVFEDMFSSPGKATQQMESGLLGDAEDEIDKLFGV